VDDTHLIFGAPLIPMYEQPYQRRHPCAREVKGIQVRASRTGEAGGGGRRKRSGRVCGRNRLSGGISCIVDDCDQGFSSEVGHLIEFLARVDQCGINADGLVLCLLDAALATLAFDGEECVLEVGVKADERTNDVWDPCGGYGSLRLLEAVDPIRLGLCDIELFLPVIFVSRLLGHKIEAGHDVGGEKDVLAIAELVIFI